jgi:hypothetical protein
MKRVFIKSNLLFLLLSLPLTYSLAATQAPANLFFCPDAHSLVKDPTQMTWSTPDKQWKSYGTSFETNLTEFWGAQWNGTVIGQITCIYHAAEKSSFPVLLIYHALTLEPHSGQWTPNLGGFRNCYSHNKMDCPFQVRLQPKEQNIYDEAESLKSKNTNQNPGF